jgi:epoxyqueuosine reductase
MVNRNLRSDIECYVRDRVEYAGAITRYRSPLVGFADAHDPAWARLRQIAEATHMLPTDLLPGAQSVVAFFLPFGDEVVQANRQADGTAPEWATAYIETNALINAIAGGLVSLLAERGIAAAAQPSTHNWDPVTLVSQWSHKSAAAIAGLGSFGLHRMLITDLGCAGRCGSLAMAAHVAPTSGPQPERCGYFHDGSCTFCIDNCPASALRAGERAEVNIEKSACYAHIQRVSRQLGADCCGKCAVGPCALRSAVR